MFAIDPRKYGYKRLETDEELQERVLKQWGRRDDRYALDVLGSTGETLDKLAWHVKLQRKLIEVY